MKESQVDLDIVIRSLVESVNRYQQMRRSRLKEREAVVRLSEFSDAEVKLILMWREEYCRHHGGFCPGEFSEADERLRAEFTIEKMRRAAKKKADS